MYSSGHRMQLPKSAVLPYVPNIEIYHICSLPAETIENRYDR